MHSRALQIQGRVRTIHPHGVMNEACWGSGSMKLVLDEKELNSSEVGKD